MLVHLPPPSVVKRNAGCALRFRSQFTPNNSPDPIGMCASQLKLECKRRLIACHFGFPVKFWAEVQANDAPLAILAC